MLDPALRADLSERLFQSDQEYFAAGAERIEFGSGHLLVMRGLEHVAAGCVAVPRVPLRSPSCFVAEAVDSASAAGAALLRFYCRHWPGTTCRALVRAGLTPTIEQAFVHRANGDLKCAGPLPATRIRPAREDSDWSEKLRLADTLERLPDGKSAAPAAWTELEQRKAAAGYMDMWLIELDGEVCGAFGLARHAGLLRLKNLVVKPNARRQGIARRAVSFALDQARALGCDWLGVYGISGSAGSAFYAGCEFELIGEQIEWARPLHSLERPATAERLAC